MKKDGFYKGIIIRSVLIIFSLILVMSIIFSDNGKLIYEYKNSVHHEFYFENEHVVFKDEVSIKNTTSEDLYFYMFADVREDFGLVDGKIANACMENTLKKEKFFIKSNSQQKYMVYFKIKKGSKDIKLNRLPPKQVNFQILEQI